MQVVIALTAVVLISLIVFNNKVRPQWPASAKPVPLKPASSAADRSELVRKERVREPDKRINRILEQVAAPVVLLSTRSASRGIVDLAPVTRVVGRGTAAWREIEIELIRRVGELGYVLELREGDRGLEAVLRRIDDGWADQLPKM